MKKFFCIIVAVLVASNVYSQVTTKQNVRDSLLEEVYDKVWSIELQMKTQDMNGRFKMYKTENIYTFLKLDTATGQIDQVQWSLDSDKEGYVTINNEDLSLLGTYNGSFELYPTSNMYQFILLDTRLGRMWHVQWGIGESKRWIRRM